MRYLALATDYDGTLATGGRVDRDTVDALGRLRDSGRKLVLVTGRQLSDLIAVFPEHDIFDYIVSENGAVLYVPSTREEKLLCRPVSKNFVAALQSLHIAPLDWGRAVVATREPHLDGVLRTIQRMGLDLQIVLNKGAIMVLPTEVSKASGLRAALSSLAIPALHVVAVGDAENDQDLLSACGCSVAVANALPSLKEQADLVMSQAEGRGVVELISDLIATDLSGSLDGQAQSRL